MKADSKLSPLLRFSLLSTFIAVCVVLRLGAGASKAPVRSTHGMVVSTEVRASRAGVEILKQGGNAVDAAVAVGFMLAVTHPSAGNLGGGGFMMIRMSKTGETVAVDYREMAPAGASRSMYLDKEGNTTPEASTVGYRAIAVPGTVAGLSLALEKYGTMRLPQVMAPSIELARAGLELSYFESESLKSARKLLSRFPETMRLYLRDGNYYSEGETFVQPDLARCLELIARNGPREFYEGSIAQLIVKDMQAHGGLITVDDLKAYRSTVRKPIEGTYRGYRIFSMPPPSSGGIALVEMLNILEAYPLADYGQGASRTLHLLAEAMKRAFADRAEYLGDPDFVRIPIAGLISKRYAAERRATIDPFLASDSSKLGYGKPGDYESEQTTHFSIVDAAGNVVANTYTLNGGYGSGVTIPGTGILMNNEMDDFSSRPGAPNAYGLVHGEANSIAPRKRPLSAMAPTIVVKDDKPLLVLGSPGGPTIINTVLQTLINTIDFRLTVQEAVDAPRIHHQWMPDKLVIERIGFAQDVMDALKARGHSLELRRSIGDCHAIMIDSKTGVRLGAADPRMDGVAIGY
jgi:gamma-glutamyltranspeptidase / glutathione hydrolase